MGKRGPKPKGKVKIKWSPDFAYAIGLIATDGNLSKDGRHISFVSKDIKQIRTFVKCLNIHPKIGQNQSGYDQNKTWRVQFSDAFLHEWLIGIGLMPNKSKIIGTVAVPKKYFLDFLRGCFDGDGCSYSYWDPRWRSSFMFYLALASGSPSFLHWIKRILQDEFGIKGHITRSYQKSINYQLKYSKHEAIKLVKKLYTKKGAVCLERKRLKISRSFVMMGLTMFGR